MIQLHSVRWDGVRGNHGKVTFNVVICNFINVIEGLHCSGFFYNDFFFLHFFSNLITMIKTLNVCLRLFCVICETTLALMHNNVAPKSHSTAL